MLQRDIENIGIYCFVRILWSLTDSVREPEKHCSIR